MDVGYFRKTELRLTLWLVLPLVLIGTTYYGTSALGRYVARVQSHERKVMALVVQAEGQLGEAGTLLAEYDHGLEHNGTVSDAAVHMVGETAKQCQVSLLSLQTQAGSGARKSERSGKSIQITAKAEGELPALILCLNKLTEGNRLLHIESIRLKMAGTSAAPFYNADVNLGTLALATGKVPAPKVVMK